MPLQVVNKLPKPASIRLDDLRCTDTFLLTDNPSDRDLYMVLESDNSDGMRVVNLTSRYPTVLSGSCLVMQVASTLTVTECLTVAVEDNERALIRGNQKIQAIKALRDRVPSLGLREAKMLIDAEAMRLGC